MSYKPPYVITPIIVSLAAKISGKLGQLSVLKTQENKVYRRNKGDRRDETSKYIAVLERHVPRKNINGVSI
jgi:hypothetical protein